MTYKTWRIVSRACGPRSAIFGGSFDVEGNQRALAELDSRLSEPGIWDDAERAKSTQQQRGKAVAALDSAQRLLALLEEAETFLDLAKEGEQVGADLVRAVISLEEQTEAIELETLLVGEHDAGNAMIEIHSGAGGTESQDWAEMLLRMYTRWAERREFTVRTLDIQVGDEAGIKSVTLSIEGPNAYGYLKAERGVHRLVRISPFDAQARRHTSFASVEIIPEIEGTVDVEIDPKDLRVDTFRASGAGGQHVNKTESAIRITHVPSGFVVSCQAERSQHRNREVAMQMLASKLLAQAQRDAEERMAKELGQKSKIEWGNQIRSYVLAPYRMVKDHRTSFEVGDADGVLDGDLDGFIRAQLAASRSPARAGSAS